jgi:deoxycytidylate deaminase
MITSKDVARMKITMKALCSSKCPRYLMSSALFKGGRLVSIATNSSGPPAFFLKKKRENMSRHAEVRCLFGLSKEETKGSTLYICGKTTNDTLILTRPCPSCYDLVKAHKIKRIVYMNKAGELIEERV